jgi:hypothetical protein
MFDAAYRPKSIAIGNVRVFPFIQISDCVTVKMLCSQTGEIYIPASVARNPPRTCSCNFDDWIM